MNKRARFWLAGEVLCLLGWDLKEACLPRRLGLDEMAG